MMSVHNVMAVSVFLDYECAAGFSAGPSVISIVYL